MKPFHALVAAVTLATASSATLAENPPSDPETVVVVVRGVGTDPPSAKADAMANAVTNVVGSIVDAETEVKNDKIIRDQILTASNGIIVAIEVVGTPLSSGGLVSCTFKT